MNKENFFTVIMAGGIGSRFWPFSRSNHPKQFHDVLGTGKSMLQETVNRHKDICPRENVKIVTSEQYRDLCKEHLPDFAENQFLLEPDRKNTAPCIAYAAYQIYQENPDAVMLVCPSDHVILKENAYTEQVLKGLNEAADKDILITLGIKPHRPDTGYGYIQYITDSGEEIKKVKTFTEKPQLELAKKFLDSGDFVWNAGIFIWSVKSILKALGSHLPDIAELFEEGKDVYNTSEEADFIHNMYPKCKSVSIDYGIMEKADNVYVLLSDFGWSDLGTWKSLYEISDKDDAGNVIDGNIIHYNSKNCIIKTSGDKLTVVNGVENLIIAEYDNVVMICNKDEEQKVKAFVNELKAKGETKFI